MPPLAVEVLSAVVGFISAQIPEIEHATSRPLDRVSFTPGGTLNLFANPTKFPLVR